MRDESSPIIYAHVMSQRRLNILLACGARPNFMKIASLIEAFSADARIDYHLVHTGQHYDANMSQLFFDQLELPRPHVNLGCAEASHARQTADILQRFEPVLQERRPDWLVVVGDVNSTLACAMVASKCGVRIAHVEAGLRSFDRTMPEEINRVLTDCLSDLLFVTEPAGMDNLAREGFERSKCHLVGDTLADTLLRHLPRAREITLDSSLQFGGAPYAVLTLHRPSNVDSPDALREIVGGLIAISCKMPVVFPVHPRTAAALTRFGLEAPLHSVPGIRRIAPLGYLDFLKLMSEARLVLTDSGGIQEETTILGVPCMTLRETTERPYTLTHGTNRLVKPTAAAMTLAFEELIAEPSGMQSNNPLTDGRAGQRITQILISQQSQLDSPRPRE